MGRLPDNTITSSAASCEWIEEKVKNSDFFFPSVLFSGDSSSTPKHTWIQVLISR